MAESHGQEVFARHFCLGQDYNHCNCCRYVETAVYTGHTKDVREQKQAQLKAKKDAEKAIIKLSGKGARSWFAAG